MKTSKRFVCHTFVLDHQKLGRAQLQQYYSDGSWRNAGTVGRATVRSGGGSGYRATGRAACYSNSQTGWRSLVDVNVVGIIDDPGKLTTPSVNVFCRH